MSNANTIEKLNPRGNMANTCDGKTLKDMFTTATLWLEKSAPDINAINVFPVPDGDTGTNMLLTMRSAIEEANQSTNGDASLVAKAMAHGALMGARGNSGVILSQFWRGLAKGLDNASFSSRDFANALQESVQAAYKGVIDPVEGTILTVLKDTAQAAYEAARVDSCDLAGVMEVAVEAAKNSVARTPELLPILKETGVVDAGGEGLYILLEGALLALKGETNQLQHQMSSSASNPEIAVQPKPTQLPSKIETPYGYCTSFVLEGQSLDQDKVRKDLIKKGESLAITGDDSLLRIHIHCLNPGEILNYATRQGKLHEIRIENMDDQYAEFLETQRDRLPAINVAIVTVVAGDGFFKLFSDLGNVIVVPGGQTMNPSVRQLLQAVESTPTSGVILLPNNKNIVATAYQVIPFTSKKVKVIPTTTVPQGIAATLSFNPDMDIDENVRSMEEARKSITTIEITKAVRKTQVNAMKIKKGKPIAILDDKDLIACGENNKGVILEALTKSEVEKAEVITIYCGDKAEAAETDSIVQEIHNRYQGEVEVIQGGQPHYDYTISLE
jgi:uncharacterized protein